MAASRPYLIPARIDEPHTLRSALPLRPPTSCALVYNCERMMNPLKKLAVLVSSIVLAAVLGLTTFDIALGVLPTIDLWGRVVLLLTAIAASALALPIGMTLRKLIAPAQAVGYAALAAALAAALLIGHAIEPRNF